MTDREKIIKRLEECLSASCRGFRTCPYSDNEWDAVKTALALLQEQEPEIVRCKDCKHYDPDIQLCHNGLDGIFLPDWFCADGERR